jgi:RNA polymerase sigma factor (sigma-70 family)
VFNTCLSYVLNTEDAEDITQEVFIEIYRSLDKFKQEANISTWIYRITVNKSLDFLRRKKSKKRFAFFSNLFHEETGEIIHEHADFEHPGVRLENKESSKYLFKVIETLPESQKTAFILFTIEELSQKEISAIMNMTPKAIESLIQRAKVSLRKKLEFYYDKRRKSK